MSFLKKIFKLLKKIWAKIRKVLGPLLLILAVLAPVLAPYLATLAASLPSWLQWLPTAYSALGKAGWGVSAAVGLGVGYVTDPEGTSDLVSKVADGAKDVIGGVVDVGTSAIGSFFKSPIGIGILAFGAYFLLRKD